MTHDIPGRLPPLPPERKRADIARLRLAMALESSASSSGHQRWSRRTAVVAGAAVLTIGGGAAAATTIIEYFKPATVTTSGRCYWEVSRNFDNDFPGSTAANATRSSDGWTPDVVSNLVEMCAAEWRAGALWQDRGDPTPEPSPTGEYPIPELVPCVLPNGQAAVFPGDSATCNQLGLPGLLVLD